MTPMYAYKGRMVTMAEAVSLSGLTKATLVYRMKEHGLSLEEAIKFEPRAPMRIEYDGRMMTFGEMSRETGIKANTIRARYNAGVPIEIAATAKVCSRGACFDDVSAKRAERTAYIKTGDWREVGAKRICREFCFGDPRTFGFRADGDGFLFDTESISFSAQFDGHVVTVKGRMKKNNTLLIKRTYIVNDEGYIREVHTNG